MKKIQLLPFLLLFLVVAACETGPVGPVGPSGPQGAQGVDGLPGESGIVFEFQDVDIAPPNYEVFLNFDDNFEGLESDHALVYLLWDIIEDSNGDPLDVWRQVPQSLLTQNGLLIYNFDFSRVDVRLFLAAEFDLGLLGPLDLDDWIVRVVVIPGDFWGGRTSVDVNDYYAVEKAYGLPKIPAHTSAITRRN